MWTCECDLCVRSWSVTMWSCSGDFSACCRSQATLSASRSSTMKVQPSFSLSPSLSVCWCDLHLPSSLSSLCVCLTLWCAWFILCKTTKQTSNKSTPMKRYFVKCRNKWSRLRLDKESLQINKNIKTQTKNTKHCRSWEELCKEGTFCFSTDHQWRMLNNSWVLAIGEGCWPTVMYWPLVKSALSADIDDFCKGCWLTVMYWPLVKGADQPLSI